MSRGQDVTNLWYKWEADPSEENMGALLDALSREIDIRVNTLRRSPVPPAALRGHAHIQAVHAIKTFDPNNAAGATLPTWATTNLKKVNAFVHENQNIGKMPSKRIEKITQFKEARQVLELELGHPPDALTLTRALGWDINEVGRMERELRQDLIASRGDVTDTRDEVDNSYEKAIMRFIYQELSREEREVLEYSWGTHGKPKLPAGEIASRLNLSRPKVSRIRNNIHRKIDRWMKES